MSEKKKLIADVIKKNEGIIRLKPAWVARDFLPPGRRLGLPEGQYELGERGAICERWIGSTTKADNKISVPNEGLSVLDIESEEDITLKEAVEIMPEEILGAEYSKVHNSLKCLPKIFDYKFRLPYHIHQMQKHAKLVGCNSKEEAYYFPEDVDLGEEAETYFGVHPYIAKQKKYDVLLRHMIDWKDDSILQHAKAFKQIPGDGFHVPSGTLHAPGSALTIELQEDSDVFAMLQAKTGGKIIDKELLWKDVTEEDKKSKAEKIILDMINWKISGDPYFYENRHTPPLLINETKQDGGEEYWIFYNTNKFSGKKLVVSPGDVFVGKDNGVYNILVWRGKGLFAGLEIEGENFAKDELIITHDRAVKELKVENTGDRDLIIYKFFGPDVNPDVPFLKKYDGN
ncbi:MAG: hypothetical protein K9J16_03110 [Melioribacteraceae bacterium]|nr:hypothetical protein [Melioribacteraceae bacterium]MCF8353532.1 hypothetical protein [Melioribacteraceae bacterium]MCF8392534.1 hypothetical protein [Melioribacteraceae bacterium]MCF8418451.1 hypothetical protein [Melioribacteraceae bacterium]